MAAAAFLEALADALDAASATLRQRLAVLNLESYGQAPDAVAVSAVERARAMHPQLGRRQAEVLELLERAGHNGTTTGAISRAIGYDQPNVYLTLQALINASFVEKDESAIPHRYRLTSRLTDARWHDRSPDIRPR